MKTVFLILNYKTYNDTIRLTKELLLNELGDRLVIIVDNASPNESFSILNNTFKKTDKVESGQIITVSGEEMTVGDLYQEIQSTICLHY